jgi:hypothetical protein
MWKDEKCLIVSFLGQVSEGVESPEEEVVSSSEASLPSRFSLGREEAEVPKWLKRITPEEIAVEILEFKEREFPEGHVNFHTISRFYWSNKGIEKFLMPTEIEMKISKAELMAEREMLRKEETQKKERLGREKEELPSLVSQCVDWARLKGLRRLTLADVDTYALEKDLDIVKETKRSLYAIANLKLKSGR